MAIAPSNNLLNALSQLQGNARPAAPAKPQTGSVKASFSSQITAPIQAPSAAGGIAPSAPAGSAAGNPAPLQTLPRPSSPIPSRGGYLGQHVNIVV